MTKLFNLSIATILGLQVMPAVANNLTVNEMNRKVEKCFQQTVLVHQKVDPNKLSSVACTQVINSSWISKIRESNNRLNRGIIYMAQGHYNKAIKDFRRTLSLTPDSYSAHVALAQLLNRVNDFTGAIHHYDQAIALNNADKTLLHNRQLVANSILLDERNRLTRQVSIELK
jgi:tetratricopeptide (TPR) repeat protein